MSTSKRGPDDKMDDRKPKGRMLPFSVCLNEASRLMTIYQILIHFRLISVRDRSSVVLSCLGLTGASVSLTARILFDMFERYRMNVGYIVHSLTIR